MKSLILTTIILFGLTSCSMTAKDRSVLSSAVGGKSTVHYNSHNKTLKENFPPLSKEDKKNSIPKEKTKKRLLIVTATKYETNILQEIALKEGLDINNKTGIKGDIVYQLGALGDIDIYQVQTPDMGMIKPGSIIPVLMSVGAEITPDYIIATGIAFGRESKGQKLGEILVSSQVVDCETRKLKGEKITISRGDKVGSPMVGRINAALSTWKGANVHVGIVLCSNVLVSSQSHLDKLAAREPEYTGGEMESYGLYTAAQRLKADWIMIKGISDWGDETKHDGYHEIALKNTMQFIFHIIKDKNLD